MTTEHQVTTKLNLKNASIAFIIVGFFVLLDVSISSLVDVYYDFSTSSLGIATFIVTTVSLFCGTYFILKIAENKISGKNRNERYDKRLAKVVWAVFYIMILINAFIISQILFFPGYFTGLLSVASSASYGLASFMMGLLAYHFFSWFARNRSLVVLLYGLASASVSAYVGLVAIIFYIEIFIHQPVVTTLQSAGTFPGIESIFEEILIVTLPGILTATTFLLFWGGTISILYANMRRIGKARFWILVTAPIVFFLSTLISLFPELQGGTPENDLNSIIIPLYITNFSQIIAIALFAIAFVSMARAIGHHQISDFMYITCFGLTLFSIGIIATISGAGYPPFGLPTISLVGPFSFLLFIGLHRSAISTAEDSNLRRYIKTSTQQQLALLKSIGTAEMQQKLEKNILEAIKLNVDDLLHQSGVEPTISMDETRQYIYEALEEMKKLKNSSTQT